MKTEVKIVNGVGDDVVLDVFCEDHIGVLWVIARTLAERGLTIALAKISTQGHRVADGFYLRDAVTGERVTDHARLHEAARSLRDELSDVLKDRREAVSSSVAAQSR